MQRRTFLAAPGRCPMGLNTYCLRALRWNDAPLLEYCAQQRLDAVFLQDSLDPAAMEPAHWREVREQAVRLGLHLETGGGSILPRTPEAFSQSVDTLLKNVARAKAMGSPIVRALLASDRAALPPGPVEQHVETVLRVLKAARSQVMDAGLKIAIELHKDLHAFEHRMLIEAAGPEFVGSYLDTGNPVFMMEHPLTAVEELGRYALTVHLRDSVVYETRQGVAVQWVPLGEGTVDFQEMVAAIRRDCPPVFIYIKPITGRPPQELAIYRPEFWKPYPKARAADVARFIALAKKGQPYDRPVVVEDLHGRPIPPHFLEAVKYQQRDHVERSIAYARKVLGLGLKSA